MKAVIPAKKSSIRVPNKNFKSFHNEKSLADITIEKLLKILAPEDIYLSCEDEIENRTAKKWGINFILREKWLVDNDTKFHHVFNGVCDQIKGDDDIAWCHVCDPMFDGYKECFDAWNNRDLKYDSLVLVYPVKDYFLNSSYEPEGFNFGPWHKKSQLLPVKYHLTFTLSILTRNCIKECGYWVGTNPIWHHAHNPRVDIDTLQEFKLAQAIYSFMCK